MAKKKFEHLDDVLSAEGIEHETARNDVLGRMLVAKGEWVKFDIGNGDYIEAAWNGRAFEVRTSGANAPMMNVMPQAANNVWIEPRYNNLVHVPDDVKQFVAKHADKTVRIEKNDVIVLLSTGKGTIAHDGGTKPNIQRLHVTRLGKKAMVL